MQPPTYLVDLINCPESLRLADFDANATLKNANEQGVAALIAEALMLSDSPDSPEPTAPEIVDLFTAANRQAAAMEMLLEEERRNVLSTLERFRPLLLKGSALAYLYYSSPFHRPMVDIDLLISLDSGSAVREALLDAGYKASNSIDGDLVMRQFMVSKECLPGTTLTVDVHTRLFNRPVLSDILSYQELASRAIVVPALGEHAMAPCPAHLLAHACLHLTAHHHNSRRLIWLYDIMLLVRGFNEQDVATFIEFTDSHGLTDIMWETVNNALSVFPTSNPELVSQLNKLATSGSAYHHPATELLSAHSVPSGLWQDWKHLDSVESRFRWLRQHMLPNGDYMMKRYQIQHRGLLPAYYLWRIVRGSVRLFRPRG